METGLSILFHANLPKALWVEAFLTAVHLINRLHSSTLGMKTPFQKLYGKYPDYLSLKVFGCRCFPYLRDRGGNKFSPKSYPCIFVGYSGEHKGYRSFHLPSKKIYISRHVFFDERILPYTSPPALFSPSQESQSLSCYNEFHDIKKEDAIFNGE